MAAPIRHRHGKRSGLVARQRLRASDAVIDSDTLAPQAAATRIVTVTAPAPVVTATANAPGFTLNPFTTQPTGRTSLITTNGGVFTIVVVQVTPTTSATASTPSTFSNPFFNLPSLGTYSSSSRTATGPIVVTVTSSSTPAGFNTQTAQSGNIINPTINNDSAGGLSTGAIVGIAIGAFAGVVLLLALLFWALAGWRDRRAREEVTDMMGTSNLPDPYAGAFISREVPGSFVRFHDDDDMGSLAGAGEASEFGGPSRNAYDDMTSVGDEDYVDVNNPNRPLSPFRGSRAYTGTY